MTRKPGTQESRPRDRKHPFSSPELSDFYLNQKDMNVLQERQAILWLLRRTELTRNERYRLRRRLRTMNTCPVTLKIRKIADELSREPMTPTPK